MIKNLFCDFMFTKKQLKRENPIIDLFARKDLVKVYNKGNPICINLEINQRCAGGCKYCYASSVDSGDLPNDNLSLDKFKEILELRKLGVQVLYLYGGDQLLHPDCKEMVFHAIEEGFHLLMPLAGLIPKSKAKWLVEAQKLAMSKNQEFFIGIHIDSLDQSVYNQVNRIPSSLKAKIEGYQGLLDEGFPPDRIYGCPTLTVQTAETIIHLLDWFYEKGVKHMVMAIFTPLGLSKNEGSQWEPTLSQIEKAFRYRAKIEGKLMLMVGSADGKYACQSHFAINAKGDIIPCLLLPDLSVGNIYENKDNLINIVKKGKKQLLLKYNVKGPCASCVSRHVCIGCRARAHIYLGDITASDPKCFFNPEAPERCSTINNKKND